MLRSGLESLPVTAELGEYMEQAELLLRGHVEGDPDVLRTIGHSHPRFLDTKVSWLPLPLSIEEIRNATFDIDDAQLALARSYSFRDWDALATLVNAVQAQTPVIHEFELASEAVISGDLEHLGEMLHSNPDLAKARSSRVTCQEPSVHRATLLHYTAANGVESYRQRTPQNAVEIAKALLDAGSDPNALASMYGGECTTLSMLVSSSPPAEARLQTRLAEILIDHGADPNGGGTGKWNSPILTALVFGFRDAAEALARRGARVDRLAVAAGLGRLADAGALLPVADQEERRRALALAVQLGHIDLVRVLLDSGESPDSYNPEGTHAHATPLHNAALSGNYEMVRLLLERGARPDIPDKIWRATPSGWAMHGGHNELAEYLGAMISFDL